MFSLTYKRISFLLVVAMSLVMVVLAIAVTKVLSHSDIAENELSYSLNKLNRLQQILITMVDAETGERGYVITGNVAFLQPFENARMGTISIINPDSLHTAMPEYSTEIDELNMAIKKKFTFTDSVIQNALRGNVLIAVDMINSGEERKLMEDIRNKISALQQKENTKLLAIKEELDTAHNNIFTLLISSIIVCLILLVFFYVMVLRNMKIHESVQQNLIQAKTFAEEANKAKSNFLVSLSHEIRTPMNTVIGASSMLLQTPLSEEQKKYAEVVHRSSLTLISIIEDMMDFTKIEAGKFSLEYAAFSLKDCIEEVFSIIAPSSKKTGIFYSVDAALPHIIEGDPIRLRQVLINLVGNAVKNMETGYVRLDVHLLQAYDHTIEIEFVITDTGEPAEKSDEIFISEDGNTEPYTGPGLGLSISARLISLMGGAFKIEQQSAKGSVTTFTIKANKVEDKISHQYGDYDINKEKLDSELSKRIPLNILIVDDNEMNRTLLIQVLMKMGYTCKIAVNGEKAAQIATEEKFDLILMDIVMPVMDGIEATHRIREFWLNNEKPIIIALTANVLLGEKEKAKCLEAGLNDFLTKPYKPKDMQTLIEKWGAKLYAHKH